jgi:hypothetical protein
MFILPYSIEYVKIHTSRRSVWARAWKSLRKNSMPKHITRAIRRHLDPRQHNALTQKDVTICGDIIFVELVSMLVTISRNINFASVEDTLNQQGRLLM